MNAPTDRNPARPQVFFDHQIFDLQRVGGASRVFSEILARGEVGYRGVLGVERTRNEYLLGDHGVPRAEDATRVPRISTLRKFAYRIAGSPVPMREVDPLPAANRAYGERLLEQTKPDLLAPTYYDPYLFERKNRPPMVATVLDLIPERYPEFYLGDDRHSLWKRQMVEGCDHMVAISESTKNDLMQMWHVPEEKIDVVPLASSFTAEDARCAFDSEEAAPADPYLLYVGERGRYKNFYFLLECLRGFLRRHPEWKVLCVGGAFAKNEKRFLEARALDERVATVSGDDAVVADAYRQAACVVIPSLAEGFGLPVIEALAFGRPVAASRIPVFREIAGDRIDYFDPKDPLELASVVEKVCLRGEESEEVTDARRKHARNFTWEATAKGYAEAFRHALS